MTPQELLLIKMPKNAAGARTMRDYLKAVLTRCWLEGVDFDPVLPFRNSAGKRFKGDHDWHGHMYVALIQAGVVKGIVTDDTIEEFDADECHELVRQAIAAL